jgi:threonine/homoserine/homoserine lactone efflux protein
MGSYFFAAALIVATPGADVLLVIATSLASGRKSGLAAVFGMASGYVIHAVAASLGIAVLLAGSPSAIRAVEAAGAVYLFAAGINQIRRRKLPAPTAEVLVEPFRRGFFSSLLNPKGALFFLAFLPQFLPKGGGQNGRAFALGLVFSALTILIYGFYAFTASAARSRLNNHETFVRMRILAGVVFIGLGINAAASAIS